MKSFNRPIVLFNKTLKTYLEYSSPTKLIGVVLGYNMQHELYDNLKNNGKWENDFYLVTYKSRS